MFQNVISEIKNYNHLAFTRDNLVNIDYKIKMNSEEILFKFIKNLEAE